MTTVTRMWWNW